MNTDKKAVERNDAGKRHGKGGMKPARQTTGFPRSPAKPKFTGDCEDLAGCIFDCEDSRRSGEFEGTIDQLANYVGSKFEHGGEIRGVIKNLEPVVIAQPQPLPDFPAPNTVQNKIWELDIVAYVKKRNKIDDGLKKLYSLIWGQCTDHMKAKLESTPGFSTMNNNQDSLTLLKEIKGFTFQFDSDKYLPLSLAEATCRLYRFYQGRDMTNSQYLERFKSLVAVIEHYGGTIGRHPKMDEQEIAKLTGAPFDPTESYNENIIRASEKKAKEKTMAALFLLGSDKIRYGDMTVDLHNDFIKGNAGVFPATLQGAYSLMVNWRPSFNHRTVAPQLGTSFTQEETKPKSNTSTIACWGCGKEGIVQSDCNNPACVEKWKAKLSRKGMTAEGQQHLNVDDAEGASSFDFKDTNDFALDDYAGFSFYQTNAGHKEKVPTPIQEPDTNSQDGKDDHWDENEGHSFHQGRKVNEDIILLDNQSTHTTFYNRKLMKNIRPAPIPLRMLANGGDITYDQIGDVAGYGTGYYNKNGIANILSMAEAEAMGHEITYTPGCFTMTNCVSNRDTKFHRTPAGLYAHKVKRGVSLIQTVAENEAEFTPRQVEKAKEARDLYAMIGRPSYRDYLAIIKNDLLPNAKITPSDVERAEKIYGKDLGAIQGKTT